ncbi:uncharacterized protein LOC113273021 [Papaver somniferum]|uniref:uncharacterized protein LOC113273021 n=1 Tax=Papaver somniferum TaxID=3469 RepID=UPI000E70594A|nr:uncharacterized protein LOC113273021 [Papaver somniferum]
MSQEGVSVPGKGSVLVFSGLVADSDLSSTMLKLELKEVYRGSSSSPIAPESDSSSAANGRTTWTPPMDQLFIELMVEQVVDKQLLDGQFSKTAWEYPECKQWRTRSLPQYNELAMIFGDSRATGKHSRFRDDNNRDNNEVYEDREDNTQDQNENLEGQNEYSMETTMLVMIIYHELPTKSRTSIGYSSRSFRKTKKSTGEGMVEEINLASAVNIIATKKEENGNSSLEKSVVVALEEIVSELDEFLFMQALELLEDEKKAKIFIELSGDRRRRWLLSKLNYSDYY